MQPLQTSSNEASRRTAGLVLGVVPGVMDFVRASHREAGVSKLTIPQARTLALVQRHPRASISRMADLMGISLPAASRLVEGLVTRKLLTREISREDRRNVCLMLTERGKRQFAEAVEVVGQAMALRLAKLKPAERKLIEQAMIHLREVFGIEEPG